MTKKNVVPQNIKEIVIDKLVILEFCLTARCFQILLLFPLSEDSKFH